MNTIEYWMHFAAYHTIAAWRMAPVLAPAFGLIFLFDYFEIESGLYVARIIAVPFLLALLFIPSMVAETAAFHRVNLGAGFWESFQVGWEEFNVKISFLPIVRRWFGRNEDASRSDREE